MLKRVWKDLKNYWAAIIVVILFYFLMHAVFDAFCPSVIVFGLPCPGCGLTRSVLFFVTGQWERSFLLHPLGWAIVVFAFYFAFFRYVRGKRVPGVRWILLGFIVVAIVLFVIRMGMYFPDRPPYTYNSGNLAEMILPGYKEVWR